MRRKIRNSLNLKVFLWVFTALTVCSMLIYCIVMAVLPKQYQFTEDKQLDANAEVFVSELRTMRYDDGIKAIYNFCIRNNSAAVLLAGNEMLHFGEIASDEQTLATSSVGINVRFLDRDVNYMLVISSVMRAADRISGLLLRLLPVIFLIIIVLSVLSALICSKIIVAPIARISQISKRMASLDMTWRCNVKSSDEIGILASNLNTMAVRLQTAMQESESANKQLAADVEKFQALEEQRRHFFAAVSHELKTPLTILKGQLENMILGYGDYQNHETYLPEALETVETIGQLVQEIISITKMESMDLQNTLQEVSLSESVCHTIESILPLARDKEIQIHQELGTDLTLSVHPTLWSKALSNIIGNAIRHSPCGAHVLISLQTSETESVFTVENTGVSVPDEELEHLFIPFYRADKSRSKTTGGSGLGLYIVKTILDLHGFPYSIKNSQNGIVFSIHLKGSRI